MRDLRTASVLMPTWQAIEFLERVLEALAAQRTSLAWDVWVIDSGSTDGTRECLERRRASFPVPLTVEWIRPEEFDHGDTRNLLARRSEGDLLVYLTQDAIPSSPIWLETLASSFRDPSVGAAYCRNVPRADCWPITRVMSRADPGYAQTRRETRLPAPDVYRAMNAYERRVLCNFNNVASAIRRELWERYPFPRTMMGEDVLMGRAILEAGYTIVYDADATVDHSHDYGPQKLHWRGEVDARFNAEWLDRICVEKAAHVAPLTEELVAQDLAALAAEGFPRSERAALEERVRELRRAYLEGLYEGSQAKRRYPRSAMRPTGLLRCLFVIPGMPVDPGAWLDDSAAHAVELARELQRRGHRVTVVGPDTNLGAAASFGFRRTVAHGLRVFQARAYWSRRSELASILDHEQPDVVVAFGLDRMLRPIQRACRKRGLPLVLSLDDDAVSSGGKALDAAVAADLCLVPSVALRQALLAGASGGSFDDRRVVRFVRGIDADDQLTVAKTTELEGRVRFGFFGEPTEESGAATLLAAARALRPGSCVVRIHGAGAGANGSPRAGTDGRASDADFVELVESGGPRDLPELMAEVDVVVAPDRGFCGASRAVQRAQLHATPVIASIGFGADEQVRDGVDGLHFPAGDVAALAQRLQRFVDEPDLAARLRPAAGRVLSIERSAAELEFRLRALACRERSRPLDVARASLSRALARGIHKVRKTLRARAARGRSIPTWQPAPPTAAAAPERQLRIAGTLRVEPGHPVAATDLPRIALVIPTLEGRELLDECLASVDRAEYERARLRIVVVDNGSTDGTSAHLRSARPGVHVVRFHENRGFAAACNAGACERDDAGVIVFLNNDMRVHPRFLAELVAPLVRGECRATTAKRLSWDGERLDGAGVGSTFAGIAIQPGYGAPPRADHEIERRTLFPCGGAMAIDAATFEAMGGFDEEFFAYYEDLDLGWRMWISGHATHYVPSAVAYHHHSHTSRRFPPATVRLLMIRNSLLACVKCYDDANLARVLPAVLALAARRAYLAGAVDDGALRIERAKLGRLARSGEASRAGRRTSIRALGAADLTAIDDLLGRWEHWMRRRAQVQANRVREDREILPMFLDPLACVEGDPGYQELQRGLFELYDIPGLFEQRP